MSCPSSSSSSSTNDDEAGQSEQLQVLLMNQGQPPPPPPPPPPCRLLVRSLSDGANFRDSKIWPTRGRRSRRDNNNGLIPVKALTLQATLKVSLSESRLCSSPEQEEEEVGDNDAAASPSHQYDFSILDDMSFDTMDSFAVDEDEDDDEDDEAGIEGAVEAKELLGNSPNGSCRCSQQQRRTTDEFLDEGCYLVSLSSSPVTSPVQSSTSKQPFDPNDEKSNVVAKEKCEASSEEDSGGGGGAGAASEGGGGSKLMHQRRSPSDVDSGRVSDTDMGTTCSNNSKNSNSSTLQRNSCEAAPAKNQAAAILKSEQQVLGKQDSSSSLVQIVPHTYCDFLGTMQKTSQQKTSQKKASSEKASGAVPAAASSESSSQSCSHVTSHDDSAAAEGDNKVTVFVPYSTIVRCMNETLERNKRRQKKQRHKTQVCKVPLLPENYCDLKETESRLSKEEEEEKVPGHLDSSDCTPTSPQVQQSKVYSKRMTKRLQHYNTPMGTAHPVREEGEGEVEREEEESSVNPCMLVLADEDLILPCPSAFPPKKIHDFHIDTDDDIEEPLIKSSSDNAPVIPRRKDLCKLLGLNERNIGDVLILDDDNVKVAQKVALLHTAKTAATTASPAPNGDATTVTDSSGIEGSRTAGEPVKLRQHGGEEPVVLRKKSKDLAKFLGVDDDNNDSKKQQQHRRNSALLDLQLNGLIDFDEDYHPAVVESVPPPHINNPDVIMRRKKNKKQGSLNSGGSGNARGSRPRSLLVNWSNMMKRSSVRWKNRSCSNSTSRGRDPMDSHVSLGAIGGIGVDGFTDEDDSTDDDVLKELQVPVQLRQMHSSHHHQDASVAAEIGGGVKRKDLSKFLGLDDSDSEEIVFIQNNKSKPPPVEPAFARHSTVNNGTSDTYSSFESSMSNINNNKQPFSSLSVSHSDINGQIQQEDSFSSSTYACREEFLYPPSGVGSEAAAAGDEEAFCHPPRKAVNFKEYGFSVEQSIAQGLPIIPAAAAARGQQVQPKGRKKKKEAATSYKRMSDLHKHPRINSDTSLQTLLRIANSEWHPEEEEDDDDCVAGRRAAGKPAAHQQSDPNLTIDRPPASMPVRSALRSPNSPPKCAGPVVFGANSRRTISPIRKSHYNFQRKKQQMAAGHHPQNVLIHPAALNSCLPAVFYQGQRYPVLFYGHAPANPPMAAAAYPFPTQGNNHPPPPNHHQPPPPPPPVPTAVGRASAAAAVAAGRSPHQHPRHPAAFNMPMSSPKKAAKQRQLQHLSASGGGSAIPPPSPPSVPRS